MCRILESRQDGAARLRLSDASSEVVVPCDSPYALSHHRRRRSSMISHDPGALQGGVAAELGPRPTARAAPDQRRAHARRLAPHGR